MYERNQRSVVICRDDGTQGDTYPTILAWDNYPRHEGQGRRCIDTMLFPTPC